MQTNEDATVSVKDLDLFVTVQLLVDTPPVLSLGKLRIFLSKDRWSKTTVVKKRLENTFQHATLRADRCSGHVNWVLAESTSSTSVSQDPMREDSTLMPANTRSRHKRRQAQGDLLGDLPQWLEESADNVVDGEAPAVEEAHSSNSHKKLTEKHSVFTHVPKHHKLRSMQKDQKLQGVLAETHR